MGDTRVIFPPGGFVYALLLDVVLQAAEDFNALLQIPVVPYTKVVKFMMRKSCFER